MNSIIILCYFVDLQGEERKVVLEVSGQFLSFSSMLPDFPCFIMKFTLSLFLWVVVCIQIIHNNIFHPLKLALDVMDFLQSPPAFFH